MKVAPYLFSGPNSLYSAFGGKVVLVENFAQFCLKSPLEIVFPKNTFSVWIFVLNRTSPIFLVKRTTWHDWWQKCLGVKLRPPQKTVFDWNFLMKPAPYLFSGPNSLYGAFGGKVVPDENFVLNRTSPILWAKRTRWRDWGQKSPEAKFRPSLKTRFPLEFFDDSGPIPLFRA